MKNKIFADKLSDYVEDRILELCEKFRTGKYNGASLPAFWMGFEADIETFLEENNLSVEQKK